MPPGPPPGPPPGGYSGGGGQSLDVGSAVGYGWKKFTENPTPFILLVLAVFAVNLVVGIARGVVTSNTSGTSGLFISFIMAVLGIVISFIVQAGVWRAGLAVTRGGEPNVSQFTESDNFGPYVLTAIVVGVVAAIGIFLCVIPGIIWLIFTAYAPLLALDKGMGPGDAISKSIEFVRSQFGTVFVLLLVCWLLYVLGAVLCCIGLLVTVPVALVAITYSYRILDGDTVAP